MIAKLPAVLFLFTFIYSTCADWQPQTSGTTENLNCVKFINETTGWVCGTNGKILFTTNGGTLWGQQVSNTANNLFAIDFTSASVGYGAGAGSTVIKTTNGGAVWTASTVPAMTQGISWIDFANDNTGYICGNEGKLGKTTNGGVNWQVITIDVSVPLNVITVIDANVAYTAGISGKVYKTTNGGANWNLQATGSNNFISAMSFSDASNGYFTTLGISEEVYRTTNGGNVWTPVTSPGNTSGLNGLAALSSAVVYGAGPEGKIRRTTNGGTSWETQPSGDTLSAFKSIFMVNSSVGYVVGFNGKILKTVNGGIGIQQISTGIPKEFSLRQNYPNPFNPVTNIEFSVPKSSLVKITVFDALGKEAGIIVNQNLSAGIYKADFNAENLSSGIYFYRIIAGGFTDTKKMILMK